MMNQRSLFQKREDLGDGGGHESCLQISEECQVEERLDLFWVVPEGSIKHN